MSPANSTTFFHIYSCAQGGSCRPVLVQFKVCMQRLSIMSITVSLSSTQSTLYSSRCGAYPQCACRPRASYACTISTTALGQHAAAQHSTIASQFEIVLPLVVLSDMLASDRHHFMMVPPYGIVGHFCICWLSMIHTPQLAL